MLYRNLHFIEGINRVTSWWKHFKSDNEPIQLERGKSNVNISSWHFCLLFTFTQLVFKQQYIDLQNLCSDKIYDTHHNSLGWLHRCKEIQVYNNNNNFKRVLMYIAGFILEYLYNLFEKLISIFDISHEWNVIWKCWNKMKYLFTLFNTFSYKAILFHSDAKKNQMLWFQFVIIFPFCESCTREISRIHFEFHLTRVKTSCSIIFQLRIDSVS